MNTKGLKIKDILKIDAADINKLNTKDLRKIVNRLVSASNKRVRRLEKSELGLLSPAYQSVKKRGRLFSTKGKKLAQLRNEFKVAKNFLNMKTSTAKGFKKLREETIKRLGTEFENIDQEKYFWETYRRLEESGNILPNDKGGSPRAQEILAKIIEQSGGKPNWDEILEKANAGIKKAYESYFETDETDEDYDTDEFFTDADFY